MTTKHLIIVANAVKQIPNKDNKELILNFLLGVLPFVSPNFNRNKFVEYIEKD